MEPTMSPLTMYDLAIPSASRSARIGKPEDVLLYLRSARLTLQPGDTLLLALNHTNTPIGHHSFASHPIQTEGPSAQALFREAIQQHATRAIILCSHPVIRQGPFTPTDEMLHHAAKCSLAGKLLDLPIVDYLVMNETVLESLLMDFHDRLCRLALRYSQQHANPLVSPQCPN